MKVADLQRELKALGKKTAGLKKQELVDALKAAEAENALKDQEELDLGEEELDLGEEEEQKEEEPVEKAPVPVEPEKKDSDKERERIKRLGLTFAPENSKAIKDSREKRFGTHSLSSPGDLQKKREARFGSNVTTKTSIDDKRMERMKKFGTQDANSKRKERSEKFGTQDPMTKRQERAEKFGTQDPLTKRKERAEKFGTQDPATKKSNRATRFGLDDEGNNATAKKQRTERFGNTSTPPKTPESEARRNQFKKVLNTHL